MIAGQCHCGAVRYEAQAPIVKSSYCDCAGCRHASGGPRAAFVTVRRDGFRIASGTPKAFRAATGDRCDAAGTWHFCPDCGAPLFWKGHQGDELDLFAGSLDDISLFQPNP